MKPLDTLKLPGLFLGILFTTMAHAGDGGCVKGRVTWNETREPVIAATIAFENENALKGFFTHEKGRYYACYIPQGVYTITVSFGAVTISIPHVQINDGDVKELNFALPSDIPVLPFSAKQPEPKPAHRDTTRAKPFITASNEGLIGMNVTPDFTTTEMVPVQLLNNGPDKQVSWYIDGCKVMGNPNVPVRGAESILNYNGSVPAKYGDTNGGIVAIETRSLTW